MATAGSDGDPEDGGGLVALLPKLLVVYNEISIEGMKVKHAVAVQQPIEEILRSIIDDWYGNVSSFYVTKDQLEAHPDRNQTEELKCFHDDKGHRIKFQKDELDFTYGLRSRYSEEGLVIEVSVNNKVRHFNYADFQDRLLSHYGRMGANSVTVSAALRSRTYSEIFQLGSNLKEAFTVEKRDEKADIMRLAFRLTRDCVELLAKDSAFSKALIEEYCVSPFRSAYAAVYRRGLR